MYLEQNRSQNNLDTVNLQESDLGDLRIEDFDGTKRSESQALSLYHRKSEVDSKGTTIVINIFNPSRTRSQVPSANHSRDFSNISVTIDKDMK